VVVVFVGFINHRDTENTEVAQRNYNYYAWQKPNESRESIAIPKLLPG
jgi:hypothetical protein